MTLSRLSLFVLFLVVALPSAQACDSRDARSYFSHVPPEAESHDIVLRVEVLSVDGELVTARLEEPDARALGTRTVTIEVHESPVGSCAWVGPTDGIVFVRATKLIRQRVNGIRMIAALSKPRQKRMPHGRKREELDKYIVDPAYMPRKP